MRIGLGFLIVGLSGSGLAAFAGCGGTNTVYVAAPAEDASTDPNTTDDDAGDPCAAGGGVGCDDSGAGDTGTEFNTPTVCTSGTNWTRGDRGSSSMHPGVACIDCHTKNRGPTLSIAGTVYPTGHEPDDCNGVSGGSATTGVSVIITDKAGTVTKIAVNSVGNFYSTANIAMPFQAKVVRGNAERVMTAAQTTGDCNSCHTVDGASSAPGRIVAP